jgi:F-type H+-transporting ATPase subunit delta
VTEPVTRESYAPAADRLREFAGGADAAALAKVGDELLAVAGLLAREPRLRRALSDPARAGQERAELAGELFGGKVGDETKALVMALVGARWPSASSLLDAVERLGVDALLASADRAGELADVEDELFRFGQVASGTPALAAALSDSTAGLDRRAELVRGLLDGKVRDVTLRLVILALHGFGGRGFEASLGRLVEMAAARRSREVAYVTTAVALTDAEEERLSARLGAMYGREISLKVDVDPSVVGGVRVLIGADLYDGTVARRLAQTRKALAG